MYSKVVYTTWEAKTKRKYRKNHQNRPTDGRDSEKTAKKRPKIGLK